MKNKIINVILYYKTRNRIINVLGPKIAREIRKLKLMRELSTCNDGTLFGGSESDWEAIIFVIAAQLFSLSLFLSLSLCVEWKERIIHFRLFPFSIIHNSIHSDDVIPNSLDLAFDKFLYDRAIYPTRLDQSLCGLIDRRTSAEAKGKNRVIDGERKV